MSGKPPCKFFQSGSCRNGNRCKFPHVYENSSRPQSSSNSWGAPSSSSGTNTPQDDLERFWSEKSLSVREKEIEDAVSSYREIEIQPLTSSLGFGYPAMGNIIDGRDYSFEESRLDFYQAQQNNTLPDYERKLNIRKKDMDDCIQYLKSNAAKAARFGQIQTKSFYTNGTLASRPFIPNTLNLDAQPPVTSGFGSSGFGSSGFGSTTTQSSAFGSNASNPFGSQTSPFGKAGFGTSSTAPSSGSFGTQSLGATNNTTSPFGISNNGSTGFGTHGFGSAGLPTVASSSSPFGQASFGTKPLGSSAFGSSGFGSTPAVSAAAAPSAFGSSGFGSIGSSTSSALPVSGSTKSPFGAASTSAFGSSGFGQSKPALENGNATSTSIFGGSTPSTSAFGQPSTITSTSPFGQINDKSTTSAFGQPNTSSSASPFTQSAFGSNTATSTSGFGQTSTASPFGQTSTTSPFGKTNSAFGQTDSNGPFGQNNTSSSTSTFGTSSFQPFGQKAAAPTLAPGGFGSGAFGGGFAQSGGSFTPGLVQSSQEPESIKEEDISDHVKEQFKAETFTLGMVPEIPPPLIYC